MQVSLYRAVTGVWIGFTLLWLLFAFFTKRTVRRQSSGARLVQTALLACACILIFRRSFAGYPRLDFRLVPAGGGAALAGFLLLLSGILFAIWARISLGGNWSSTVTLKQDHTLVRHGPYRLVRHPIYTGIVLALFGTAVAFGLLRCFLGVVFAAIALHLKSRVEEALMMEQFGIQYAQYRDEVKGLIPFVW